MDEDEFVARLKAQDVHLIGMGQGKLRIVTHMDYNGDMHDAFLYLLKNM